MFFYGCFKFRGNKTHGFIPCRRLEFTIFTNVRFGNSFFGINNGRHQSTFKAKEPPIMIVRITFNCYNFTTFNTNHHTTACSTETAYGFNPFFRFIISSLSYIRQRTADCSHSGCSSRRFEYCPSGNFHIFVLLY